MAKQVGTLFIEGTIDDLTYYKMEGNYYVRMKSSLTSKKFWKSKTFERSRESCRRFSEGNKLASRLYSMLEKERRVYSLFCFLKRRAILLFKEGKSLIQSEAVLMDYLHEFGLFDKKSTDNKVPCSFHKRIAHKKKKKSNRSLLKSGLYKNFERCISSKEELYFDIDFLFIQPITYGPHKSDYG